MSWFGSLAGGYAQAAKEDRARQDAFDEKQREAQLGLSSMILQNPSVPPEYKGPVMEHAISIVNTPRGKKLPSWDKMMSSLPATNTPAKVSNVQQPELTLRPPSIPPGAPQASDVGFTPRPDTTGDSAMTPRGSALGPDVGFDPSARAVSNIGPGNANGIAPPAIPPGAMIPTGPEVTDPSKRVVLPTTTIPGATGTATQAPQPVAPAGHFHIMSPEEIAQREQTVQMNKAMEISRQTGVPVARVLGFKPDVMAAGPGTNLINVDNGQTVGSGGPRPFTGARYRPEEIAGFPTGNVIDEQTHRTLPESEWQKDPEAKIAGEGAKIALKAKVDERLRQESFQFNKAMAVSQQAFQNALQKQSVSEAKQATDETRKEYQKIAQDVRLDSQRMQEMEKSLEKAKAGDQQAMFALTANHILMTAGQKGGRATQAMYNMAEQSAPWLARVNARFDKDGYLTGVVLTPEQADSMFDLAKDRMAVRTQNAEAAKQSYQNTYQEYKDFVNGVSRGKTKMQKSAPGVSGGFSVTTPDGQTHNFDTQQQLDTFNKLVAAAEAQAKK